MAFPVGAAIVGLGSLIGNWLGGSSQAAAQDRANAANERINERNLSFSQYMSDTAYQRATKDMRAAGLNPIMSVQPASTPSPGAVDIKPVNPMAGLGSGISAGISTAMDVMSTEAEVQSKGAQSQLANAQIQTEAAKALQATTSAKESAARTETMRAELPARSAQARFDKAQAEIDYEYKDYDNTARRIQQGLGTVNSALDAINPLKKLIPGGKRSREGWSGKSKDLFDYMNRRSFDE